MKLECTYLRLSYFQAREGCRAQLTDIEAKGSKVCSGQGEKGRVWGGKSLYRAAAQRGSVFRQDTT